MAEQSAKKEYNTFVRGIVTEAGPLTFPENASLDEENCVLNRDGSRQRRLGMDFEEGYALRAVTLAPDDTITSFLWENAGNLVVNQYAVVQAGTKLLIFNAHAPSTSAALLTTIDASGFISGKRNVSFTNGMGYLYFTDGTTKPAFLELNRTTGEITIGQITIEIRDFFGLFDGLRVDEKPNALSVEHHYNLLNQGWTTTLINSYFAPPNNVYPANNQQWFIGKDANDVFDRTLLDKHDFGTSNAPRGRFIIDAFDRSGSRNARSGLSTPSDVDTSYPSAVAFAFERIFYAGSQTDTSTLQIPRAPNYTGFVFFSRTLRGIQDAGRCYSDADPTSEIDSTLVETDGGYVNIPNSGRIYRLMAKGPALLVFAEAGIWAITGDEGGFTATTFQVVKISEFGVLSATSIIDAEDQAMYWNRGGIYLLAPSETGQLAPKNMTEASIQTLFNSLSQAAKRTAVGSFDPVNRRVSWMYSDDPAYDGVTFRNKYTRELVVDLVLGSFYKNSISSHADPSPYIAGYLETPDFVTNLAGVRPRGNTVTKYLTVQFVDPGSNLASISFAHYKDPKFRDWRSIDGKGVSFSSYLITGYEIMGDSARQKQAGYIVTHFKQTEKSVVADPVTGEPVADNPSGCLVQAQWDWSNSKNSGKWGTEFQAYRLQRNFILGGAGSPIDYGHEVVTTKSRLPGRGRALSLYIRSDGDKDFYLYGWAIKFSGISFV